MRDPGKDETTYSSDTGIQHSSVNCYEHDRQELEKSKLNFLIEKPIKLVIN